IGKRRALVGLLDKTGHARDGLCWKSCQRVGRNQDATKSGSQVPWPGAGYVAHDGPRSGAATCMVAHTVSLVAVATRLVGLFPAADCYCTGGNKGIGLEIYRQLASNGIMVILTARDEKRCLEVVKNLKACGLSHILFHRLEVTGEASIASMADLIKNKFEKLDILVRFKAYVTCLATSFISHML
ncbi:hypothetical protein HYC85_020912, partial [Camellia sinensis]